jgi:Coenzyme F420-dependent N5,N10-methylene tetrahydromethanopterin reductase and related flavin-dependent oxidoreductases
MRFILLTECETLKGQTHHRRWHDAIEEAVLAEEMGFYGWGTSEHHFFLDIATTSSPETLFAAVAMKTSRIRLRHMSRLLSAINPVLVAEQLAAVDILSNGRVELTTARGNTLLQLDAFGVSLEETRGRSEEALELIVRALSSDTFEHDGKYWGKIPERSLTPRVVQEPHPPLYKICQSEESARIAAQNGLGMITCDLYLGWDDLEKYLKAYNAVPDSEVTPVGKYAVRSAASSVMTAYCAETNEEALKKAESNLLRFAQMIINDVYVQLAERSAAEYGGFSRFTELRDHANDAKFLRDTTPTILVGDPDYCTEQIQRHRELGADEIVLRMDGDSHEENMRNIEWFGRYVIPRFNNPCSVLTHGAVGLLPGDPWAQASYLKN